MAEEFKKFGFTKNPYEIIDPYKIDDKYLRWDRPDLELERKKLDNFNDDVLNGRRVGLRMYGQWGSGKTWLTRVLHKELTEKSISNNKGHIVFIYTFIPQLDPSFTILYQNAIDYFLKYEFDYVKQLAKKSDPSLNFGSFQNIMNHDEICHVFGWLSTGTPQAQTAKKWLRGEKLSTTELQELKFTNSLDSDYKKFVLLTELIGELNKIFSSVVLVIDELEHVPTKFAGAIGDSLRSLLDNFSEKFGLITTFTAQKEEEWYDIGYAEALSRRFDYLVGLESLSEKSIVDFLSSHHKLYRDSEYKSGDGIDPFTIDGLTELLRLMSPQYHYPGFLLPNCGILVREAAIQNVTKINAQFIQTNHNLLRFK